MMHGPINISTYGVCLFILSKFFCKLRDGLSGLKHARVAYRYIINTIVVFKGDLLVNHICKYEVSSLLAPNDDYSGRTAPLTSKCCILYIYSTNIGTEYFKHGIYSPFFPLQNVVCFIILMYLVPVLFTFYIQGVLTLKKMIPAPNGYVVSKAGCHIAQRKSNANWSLY